MQKSQKIRLALILAALLTAAGLTRPAQAQSMSPPAAAPPETGVQLFAGKCASCHNADGSGGMSFGSVKSADLRAPGLEQTYKTDALLLRAILDGKDETGQPLHAPMPVWRGQLSTASAQAIVAYLHTLHS